MITCVPSLGATSEHTAYPPPSSCLTKHMNNFFWLWWDILWRPYHNSQMLGTDVFRNIKLRLRTDSDGQLNIFMTFVVAHSYIILHCLLPFVFIKVTFIKFSLMCTIHRDQGFYFMILHKPVVSAEFGRPIRFCKHFCNVIIWKSLMSKFHCLSFFMI